MIGLDAVAIGTYLAELGNAAFEPPAPRDARAGRQARTEERRGFHCWT
jgi:hypothetical protein